MAMGPDESNNPPTGSPVSAMVGGGRSDVLSVKVR
jgi:hypothetical protein